MKYPIAYMDIRIFGTSPHWHDQAPRVTVVRHPRAAHLDTITREYNYLTESSFNRVMRCQQHFMQWNHFNKGLHCIGHISKWG